MEKKTGRNKMTTTNIARWLALCVLATSLTSCMTLVCLLAGIPTPAERLAQRLADKALINSVRTRDLGGGYFLVEDKAEGTAYALKAVLSAEQWDLIHYKKGGKSISDFSESEQRDLFKAKDSVRENIANRIYALFEDDFDFIFFVPGFNETLPVSSFSSFAVADFQRVKNDVDGIGVKKNTTAIGGITITIMTFPQGIWPTELSDKCPETERLKGVMRFKEYSGIPASAPHEIAHTWAAYIFEEELRSGGHWGFSNAGGRLGGFKYVKAWRTEGDRTFYHASVSPDTKPNGSFRSGGFSPATAVDKAIPYSDIELYLMGLKSARELRDAGFVLDIYTGVDSDYGRWWWSNSIDTFYATGKTSYTIDDIIARYGPRVPDAGVSQKRFKVLTVILTKEGAAEDFSGFIVDDLKWLAGLPATKRKERDGYINFLDAAGGRASLEVNGLERSLKR